MTARWPEAATVLSYDPSWPLAYKLEAAALEKAAGSAFSAVHHIGSTAVPGLSAKPIIDILAEAPTLEGVDHTTPSIVALGYEPLGEYGIAGRRYFRRMDAVGRRTHHLHVFETGTHHIIRHLAFRDYLKAHTAIAKGYGALKRGLSGLDWDAYMAGKHDFVARVEGDALAWYGNTSR